MAAPIISEEGRGLSRKKTKHRMSEPGALVIEHAELSDAGQSHGPLLETNTVLFVLFPVFIHIFNLFIKSCENARNLKTKALQNSFFS